MDEYRVWLDRIKDNMTAAKIVYHVGQLARRLMGDWKEVGGIYEMRIDYGPGYRVCFARYDQAVFIIALGGDKSSQNADINAAIEIWKVVKNGIKEIRD